MYRPCYMSLGVASLLSLSLVGCRSSSDDDSTEEASAFASSCEALVGLEVEGGTVTEATYTVASEGDASSSLWPNHCLVRGSMNDRTGIDGKPYAFEVGKAYEINNQLQHSVVNLGTEDRITFIFDYVPPDRLPSGALSA